MAEGRVLDVLDRVTREVEQEFVAQQRVLSFGEYLELFHAHPVRHSRSAARYVRDMFDHFGARTLDKPWGKETRFNLFDLPWLEVGDSRREALVGQERIQQEVYRALSNFVREGRANRIVLMHGPNGSAKSTIAACVQRGLEHYSTLDDGALYRFHWVFPTQRQLKGNIGFSRSSADAADPDSYAHLSDEDIDVRLNLEIRDHPLLLIPAEQRTGLLQEAFSREEIDERPPRWLLGGALSHKAKQVFDALLSSYNGSLQEVLRHVRVERYYISRRYRVGAVTLGPQLSVDAGERQVTADRSLAALPPSLQSISFHEAFGELIDAIGGVIEFSDLLKRPLDAFKYLQITAETGEVALGSQNVPLNCVMLASGNEVHLQAFREHPEFESFRGRVELVRSPYLKDWRDEAAIYDAQIVPRIRRHVAPHTTRVAAMFAVLTRLRRPDADRYEGDLKVLVADLTAPEKMDLYGEGIAPERLSDDSAKLLRSAIGKLFTETDARADYEGLFGASPRELRTVLLDAAQHPGYACMSPFAVLDGLDELCKRTSEFSWLQLERQPGGYHDHELFRKTVRERLLDVLEDEMRVCSGIVDETQYGDLFDRYITHVSYWVKGERVLNQVTGQYEEADQRMMQEVEALLGSSDEPEALRHALINRIAAWAIDHPTEKVDNNRVFQAELRRMRESVFSEHRVAVAKLARDLVTALREEGAGLDDEQRQSAARLLERLRGEFGYADVSAADAAAALVKERFAELLA